MTHGNDSLVALVPAAGRGQRFGGDVAKQSLQIAGRSLLQWSLDAMHRAGCERALVAAPPGGVEALRNECGEVGLAVELCEGGPSRAESVLNLLQHLCSQSSEAAWVLVHDAVRPCVDPGHIKALVSEVRRAAAARPQQAVGGALAVRVDAALRRSNARSEAESGKASGAACLEQCLDRSDLWLMQTPQMFRADELLQSLQHWQGEWSELEDESQAFAANGGQVLLVPGSPANLKVTRREDLQVAELLLTADCPAP